MALSYQTVKDADLKPLSEAVAKWRNLPGQLDTIANSFRNDVSKGLRDSDWEGEAAKAAFKKFGEVEKQLRAASEEAKDVHLLLDNALVNFRSAQKRLRNVADEVAEDKNLQLSSVGLVYLDPADKKSPERYAVLRQAYEEVVRGYNDRIKTALADATEADTALHWALSQDLNGRSPGFNPDMFRSIKDAQKGRREARADSEALVKLAMLGDQMTNEQLVEANRLLRKHESDPYFAERFAVRLGPEGTLRFWQKVADQRNSDDEAKKTLAKLQKSLSHTLASATHSQSADMREWKKEMVKLGSERFHFVDSEDPTASHASYGFQIMSSLMRHGEYDTEFLKSYGTELIAFEKAHEGDLEDLWLPDGRKARLSFGSDAGNDPMAGYLEALGHNPEAAKEMFHSKEWAKNPKKENLSAHLNYLMSEREWMKDSVPGKKGHQGYGYDELGHALEAAALGIPYDRPEIEMKRDSEAANIMGQAVYLVGKDQDYVTDRPGIGDSLARMGAGYIDDLNRAVSDFGGTDYDEEVRNSAFQYGKRDGHINLTDILAEKFLTSVGQHSGGYEILSAAQHTYTLSALKAHSAPNEELSLALEMGAKTHGILDQARVENIESSGEEKAEKYAEAAEWKNFAVSQGIGLGVGLATLPFGGPAVSAGVAFVVPTVIEGAGDAAETWLGLETDRALKEKEEKIEVEAEIDKDTFRKIGKSRAIDPLVTYAQAHDIPGSHSWFTERKRHIEHYYN